MLTAMEAMDKFLRITPKVHCIPDSHMQSMVASMLTEKIWPLLFHTLVQLKTVSMLQKLQNRRELRSYALADL